MSKIENEVLDLEDRDPFSINKNIQVNWDDIIAEPNSLRSPECAWSLSRYCFKFTRLGFYICLSVIFAPIFAFFWGIFYAFYYFLHIWCAIPSLWICKVSCGVIRSFIRAFAYAVIIPITSAFGVIFSQIGIKTRVISDEEAPNSEDERKILIL